MAVEWVRETSDRGGSTEGIAGASGPALVTRRIHRRTFQVKLTDPNDGSVVAEAAPLIPQFGQPHPKDSTLSVSAIRSEAAKSTALVFNIQCEYERVGSATVANPTAEPPSIRWSSIPTELPSLFDTEGNPYCNTAGEPFGGEISRPWTDVALVYSFNSTVFSPNLIFTHVNRVNITQWTSSVTGTVPVNAALLKELFAEQLWLNGFPYFRVTVAIHFRSRRVTGTLINPRGGLLQSDEVGWLHVVANMGYVKLNAQDVQTEILNTVSSHPTRRPKMLSIDGRTAIERATFQNAIFVGFLQYFGADFTTLGIQ